MPKSHSNSDIITEEASIVHENTQAINNEVSKGSAFPNRIKNIFSNFTTEDILLFLILFLLIEEGVDDDFLIIGIILLILTD